MLCEKSKRGRLFSVYPKKGETWALFKDWDIRWSSDPNNRKYEIVEILSDYIGNIGVQVAYLDKVTGFVSLFQRTRLSAVGTFFVKPKELYKFSHRIPSSRMTGAELEGVPVGSFELDPASLPINPDDIWCPRELKEDRRTANSEPVEIVSSAISLGTKDKSRMSGNATTSQNSGDVNDIHATDGESANIRRSPGGANISEKKQSLMSSRAANNSHSTDFGDSRVKKSGCSSLEEEPNSRRSSGGATKPALIVDSDAEADTIPDSNPPQPTSFAMQETFWTGCPFCKIKYQYYSTYVNRVLRCRKCSKPFIAFNLGSPIKRATMS